MTSPNLKYMQKRRYTGKYSSQMSDLVSQRNENFVGKVENASFPQSLSKSFLSEFSKFRIVW